MKSRGLEYCRTGDNANPVLAEVMVGDSVPVDPKLLEILVCPLTKGPLTYDRIAGELISERAGLAYPIRGGVPIMLIDEARKLDE